MARPVVRLGLQNSVCQVVVGVGHVDQALDEVGALYQAEEHLETNRPTIRQRRGRRGPHTACGGDTYLRQPRDVQAFSVLHGGLAGFSWPRTLALAVGQAGPGKDVVVGQVQVRWVHRELADELQQAGQAVQQPLRRRHMTVRLRSEMDKCKRRCLKWCRKPLVSLTTVHDSWSLGSRMPELKISRSS